MVHPSPIALSERVLYLPSMGSCLLVAVGLSSCSGWTCELPAITPLGGRGGMVGDICLPRVPSMGQVDKTVVCGRRVDVLKVGVRCINVCEMCVEVVGVWVMCLYT